jgi:sec-independent protein translocase protein TatB
MFGIGGSEILVILIVALLFLGPDKLPDAAKKLSQGIRDLKKQSRVLQQTIENDEHIGGAIRDLKSALRGDELPVRPKVRNLPENTIAKPEDVAPTPVDPAEFVKAPELAAEPEGATADGAHDAKAIAEAKPSVTTSPLAGEPDPDVPVAANDDDLAGIIKPPIGDVAARTVAKEPEPEPEPVKQKHG